MDASPEVVPSVLNPFKVLEHREQELRQARLENNLLREENALIKGGLCGAALAVAAVLWVRLVFFSR